ncbi:CBS domain-containing protein [Streptomyces iakyrus]|uniref:CBS domain-containing protein n=1 Tax=Streptomyces iakyrus TaxID=68219 RepID=UPI0036E646D2
MTPALTQHPATPHAPHIRDDMTVEVALSLMAGARVDHLVLCDGDDQSTGVVTLARLTVLRDAPTYTDQVRLRDVPES